MSTTRREFIRNTAAGAAIAGLGTDAAPARPQDTRDGATPRGGYTPVVTPNGVTLPFKVVDGVKVCHLVPEPVRHEFTPGLVGECWGYNGRVHGPTIEAVQGDRLRIYVTNRLPDPTTIHWHGIRLPNGMDGVGGLTQRVLQPSETFKYEFTALDAGTFMYHSHHDEMIQMAMGLLGMIVIHPKDPPSPPPDRDYAIMLSEWKIEPGMLRPDPIEMVDFNLLTFNARAFPGTAPLLVKRGDRVRIRFGNLSAQSHHPIHLHGHHFRVVETDGGVIDPAGRWPETTVLVPVGSTRTIEFVADAPGDWALHCHMSHHTMNQMGHGLPNLIGTDLSAFDDKLAKLVPPYAEPDADEDVVPRNSIPMLGAPGPFGYVTMGGMFTIMKVRESMTEADSGWYQHPPGTVADSATPEELARDGIEV